MTDAVRVKLVVLIGFLGQAMYLTYAVTKLATTFEGDIRYIKEAVAELKLEQGRRAATFYKLEALEARIVKLESFHDNR